MRLVLGSNSPRRVQLLSQMGFSFEQRVADIDERIDKRIPWHQVPEEISLKKMRALQDSIVDDELLICADTLVFLDEQAMAKPVNNDDARKMLESLSGRQHVVITGVSLATKNEHRTFSDTTVITFEVLDAIDIERYLAMDKHLDRAGAYGIQDWIGLVGVREIQGSYTNVMGLPTHRLYQEFRKIYP